MQLVFSQFARTTVDFSYNFSSSTLPHTELLSSI